MNTSLPMTLSRERVTRSVQLPVAGALPVLATVQATVAVPPSLPEAGALMTVTTKLGCAMAAAAEATATRAATARATGRVKSVFSMDNLPMGEGPQLDQCTDGGVGVKRND